MKCMMKMPKLLYVPCMNVHITENELFFNSSFSEDDKLLERAGLYYVQASNFAYAFFKINSNVPMYANEIHFAKSELISRPLPYLK